MTPRWIMWQASEGWQFSPKESEDPAYSRVFPSAQAASVVWFCWTGFLCDIGNLY